MSPHLFSIPPGRPFLPTLAEALLDGRLVPSFGFDDNPLALADVTIYLPTRRAARALAGAFGGAVQRRRGGGANTILPSIRTLGEGDAAALFSAPMETAARPALAAVLGAPMMGDLERRLHLARLARRWRSETAGADFAALIGEAPVLPASAADALWLARDLGVLLDEMETEATPLTAIAGLGPEALAAWWQLTLTFLTIVTEHWPKALAETGRISEAAAKNAWLAAEAERLRSGGAKGPVVLAGSTATAPGTVELMRAIAHLDDGAVVLPGADRHLDARALDAIAAAGSVAAPGHPQHGLKRILDRIAPGTAVVHLTPRASAFGDLPASVSCGPPAGPRPSTIEAADMTGEAAPGSNDEPANSNYGDLFDIASPNEPAGENTAPMVAGDAALDAREAFLADALRPAETTDAWAEAAGAGAVARHGPAALDGIALIEAADARQEALAIAAAMRHALAEPHATAALVTPDRNLARRVVCELTRFGIAANDSAGRPLSATAPGALMATAIAVALSPGDPIALVSLIKHPLTRLGLGVGEARRAARAIEMIALRGSVGVADGARLAAIYAGRRSALDAGERAALPVKNLSEAERDLGAAMAEGLEKALAPLVVLRATPVPDGAETNATQDKDKDGAKDEDGDERAGDDRELADYAVALTRVLEALAADPVGDAAELYAGDAGRALAGFLSDLVSAPTTGFGFAAAELGDVVAALAAGVGVQPRAGLSARAFVWGTLEARLQSVDTMVLGGLNEGTWPAGAQSGAFLSRLMRREIALDPPERRIGLAAHDFWMAMGTRSVILSRARRSDGAPTIASRWLQRIETLAGPQGALRLSAAGRPYLAAASTLDARPTAGSDDAQGFRPAIARAERPMPRPPLDKRPTRYAVTEVETLIRDPYAIHARKILRLEPLPALMRDPHAAERGSLFHDVLGGFVAQGHDPMADDALETLIALARERFDAEALPAAIEAVWWPRMRALAENFLNWERERDARVFERHAEIGGSEHLADIDTTLTGRADRIDVMTDGSVEILDFKTGTTPSIAQARALLSPQLPLEGAMVKRGGFRETGMDRPIADLVYVRLRERTLYEERFRNEGGRGEPTDPDALSEEALAKFRGLVANLRREETPFSSRVRPFLAGDFSGDYDHLARAQEWAVGADEGEGDGDGGAAGS